MVGIYTINKVLKEMDLRGYERINNNINLLELVKKSPTLYAKYIEAKIKGIIWYGNFEDW